MKFVKYLCFVMLFLIIIVIPIKKVYEDGTISYTAISYKIVKTRVFDLNEASGYKSRTETYYFPRNFKNIEYYKEPTIPNITATNGSDYIFLNKGSINWKHDVNGKVINYIYDSINPTEMIYYNQLNVKNELILIGNYKGVNNVKAYEINNDKVTTHDLKYDNINKSIDVSNLHKGIYIIHLHTLYSDGEVDYSFKINVDK